MNKVHQLKPRHLEVAHQSEGIALRRELAEMKTTIKKLVEQIHGKSKTKVNFLNISTKNKNLFIAREDILYCQASGNYTRIFVRSHAHSFTSDKGEEFEFGMDQLDSHLLSKTLKQTAQLIDDPSFIRCHQSFLVNSNYVTAHTGTEIVLINRKKIPIARRRKHAVQKRFLSS